MRTYVASVIRNGHIRLLVMLTILFLYLPVSVRGSDVESATNNKTYNLLIVGSDRRDSSWNGNSDTIILVTVNPCTEKIYMVSFMRDLCVDIPGHGTNKINYSYAVGGAEKLKETLITNFGVQIDNYVAVDWGTAAEIIDMFGGVDIEVKDYELEQLNAYIHSTYETLGLDLSSAYIEACGMQHLNGAQAVSYSRVRFAGNNDYERTERQRRVLNALIDHFDFTDLQGLLRNVKTVLECADHDLSALDLVVLPGRYLEAAGYEVVTDRVPYDDMFQSQSEMLVPDQPATNEKLQREIYAEEQAFTE